MAKTGSFADRPTLIKRGTISLVLSLLTNYILLTAILQFELVAPYEHLAYPPVTIWTVGGVVGATLVYALLVRRSPTPRQTFVRIAIIVLLLSFIPDGALLLFDEEATLGAVVALAGLHIPPAAICVAILTGKIDLF